MNESAGALRQDAASSGFQVGTDSVAAVAALGGVSGTDESTTAVTVDGFFERPAGSSGADSAMSFRPNGIVTLRTTDFSNTTATVEYLLRLTSTDLGPLFEGGYAINQGGMTAIPIDGGIPGASVTVTSPGVLRLDMSNALALPFPVSGQINFLNVSVDTEIRTRASVPEPSTILLLIAAVGALLAREIRRGRIWVRRT